MIRVADYIMDRLAKAGVECVFQVTGRGSLFLSDALAKSNYLSGISLHHEQSCAYAAVASAEKTRNLGACLVSTGCASVNAMAGVLTAWQDGIPCFFVSGQNVLRETIRHSGIALRTYGQQEADIVSLVSPITKFAEMLTSPRDIIVLMDRALEAATGGRKGPVWLDVPLDLQSSLVDPNSLGSVALDKIKAPYVDPRDVEFIFEELRSAKRPVLLVGKGIRSARAEELLRSFVEDWDIPLTYTASAPDTYGGANRLSIGSVGAMGCSRAGNFAVQNADCVLVLGSRLTALTTGTDYCNFARSAKIIVVDIDAVEHTKKGIRIDRLVVADLRAFLYELGQKPAQQVPNVWVEKCLHWKNIFGKIETFFDCADAVDLYQLADKLGELMPAGSTLVTDSGLVEVILPSNIRFNDGIDCIHPASQGAMGFAIPAAIGAQQATDQMVLAVIGDGSVMMNLQELESIRYHRLPIKIVVINNNAYSIIRRRQRELFRNRTIGTDPSNGVSCPDFAKVADCFDFQYFRIETSTDLERGLRRLFECPGPALCEVLGREDQGYIELGQTRSDKDGRFIRRPLEDQAPFLPRDIFLQEMLIEPVNQ